MFLSFSLILPSRRTNMSKDREMKEHGICRREQLLIKNKLQGEKEWGIRMEG